MRASSLDFEFDGRVLKKGVPLISNNKPKLGHLSSLEEDFRK